METSPEPLDQADLADQAGTSGQWDHLELEPHAPRERWMLAREALAALLILGVLAGIVIPVYVDQVKKAHDTDAKNDVTTVSELIRAYVAAHDEVPQVIVSDAGVSVGGLSAVALAPGVVIGTVTGGVTDWCIDGTQPQGDRAVVEGYRFQAGDEKVEEGRCAD